MFTIVSVCKGGGYKYCRTNPPHPKRNAKGLYPLHRVLMENKLGRFLAGNEEVHHKDENKKNDDPDNLEVKTKPEHSRHHHPALPLVECRCECGKTFAVKPRAYRQRLSRSNSRVYCSRSCAGRFTNTRGYVRLS